MSVVRQGLAGARYVDPSDTQIRWLTAADGDKWNKTRADLMAAAQENMDRILRQTKIETAPSKKHQLGMLSNELVAFKAALLICPNLKEMVEPALGWPLFAVMLRLCLSDQSEGPPAAWPGKPGDNRGGVGRHAYVLHEELGGRVVCA